MGVTYSGDRRRDLYVAKSLAAFLDQPTPTNLAELRHAVDGHHTTFWCEWLSDHLKCCQRGHRGDLGTVAIKLNDESLTAVAERLAYPANVCHQCAMAAGGQPSDGEVTIHLGLCPICLRHIEVCDPRHYGSPRFPLC